MGARDNVERIVKFRKTERGFVRHTLLDTEGHRKVKQKKAYVLGLIVKNSTGSCDISTRAIIIGSLA